jgi:hypothetical protein
VIYLLENQADEVRRVELIAQAAVKSAGQLLAKQNDPILIHPLAMEA